MITAQRLAQARSWAEDYERNRNLPTMLTGIQCAVLADLLAGFFANEVGNAAEAAYWKARAEAFANACVLQPKENKLETAHAYVAWWDSRAKKM